MSNELGSFSGRPRFLIVPAKSVESRPLLVVQSEGPPHASRLSAPCSRASTASAFPQFEPLGFRRPVLRGAA